MRVAAAKPIGILIGLTLKQTRVCVSGAVALFRWSLLAVF
jgi:hypothetical protein